MKRRAFIDRVVYWLRLRGVWLVLPPFLYFAEPTPGLLVLGGALSLLGLLLRLWAGGTLRKDKVVTTTGPYAHTRNPLYLGTLMIGVGAAVAADLPLWGLAAVLLFIPVYGQTMRREARELEARFGEPYRDYARQVPLLRPRLTPYRPDRVESEPFRWERYFINKEWEAALGTLFLYVLLVARWLLF